MASERNAAQPQPSHQAELLANFALTRQALDDFIASRSPAEREATRVGDEWTARDVLAVAGLWMDYTVERMAYYARGDEPPHDVDFDALIRRTLTAYQERPWADCVAYATEALARLTNAVRDADESLLTTYNYYGDKDEGGSFYGEIQANGFICPMQDLEKYYQRVGDDTRAQATRTALTQVLGEEEPAVVCALTAPGVVSALDHAPLIVDVRGAGEYAAGHAQGAVNIPLDTLAHRIGELPQDRPIVTYCNMNHPGHSRGERAAALLGARGFAASALAGGYPAWRAAGLPEETGQR
ncbi:MAG TPA: rhodanese-like domain-containing protein [Ktedonobacterales bacterium]|nr:rhodanese-like domain-containing protein [Ktedonobacterales bacterium]